MAERIGIVGFGNMGEALAAGLLEAQSTVELTVYEKYEPRRTVATKQYGARDLSHSLEEFFASSDTIVIAIKPQDLESFLGPARAFAGERLFVSVVAGKPIEFFASALGSTRIVRLMPSLAARVGKAAVGVSYGPGVAGKLRETARLVASAVGTPYEVPERLLSAVTGISGSGIAYVFSFVHALALGGTRAGLPYAQALEMSIEVLEGAAAVLRETGEHPVSMLSKVVSPAGTTIEGVDALEHGGFTPAVMDAVTRAARRADELEKL